MNKIYTFLFALILVAGANFTATANGTDKAATTVTILGGKVDRTTIQELKLNEMQYIQLKDLNKNYLSEVETLKAFLAGNAEQLDAKMQELNNRYYAEMNKVLSSSQIEGFVLKQAIAAIN